MIEKKPIIGITASNFPQPDWGTGQFLLDHDGMFRQYGEAIAAAGGLPMILPLVRFPLHQDDQDDALGPITCGPGTLHENAGIYIDHLDGLILAGGGDIAPSLTATEPEKYKLVDKSRDIWESSLLAAALDKNKPVLGICRGAQVMNAALGGTLWADLPTDRPGPVEHTQNVPCAKATHSVRPVAGTKLAEILGVEEIMVNSHHHQAVRDLAAPLVISAYASDGLVEAVEHSAARFAIGVQWHPEGQMSAKHSQKLLTALIKAAVG